MCTSLSSTPLLNRPEMANNLRFPTEKEDDVVRIMSANIRNETQTSTIKVPLENLGKYEWSEYRASKILEIFIRYKPDALAIQEASWRQIEDIQKGLTAAGLSYDIKGFAATDGCKEYDQLLKCRDELLKKLEESSKLDLAAPEHSNANDEIKLVRAKLRELLCLERKFVTILYKNDSLRYVNGGSFSLSGSTWNGHDACTGYPRIATWSLLQHRKTKKVWLITSAQFDSKGPVGARKINVEKVTNCIKCIYNLILKDKNKQVSVVFTGDLNLFPSDKNNKRMTYGGESAYEDLTSAFDDVRDLSPQHFGPDGTFVGYPGNRFCHIEGADMDRLDHMVSRNVIVLREGVIADNSDPNTGEIFLQNNGNINGEPTPSDHYFLIADLKAKEPESKSQ